MSDDRMGAPPPPGGRRVYLGRLPPDVQKGDVEDFFAPIKFADCRIMGHFGFVEFNDPQEADDAVAHNARKPMLGADIIVEKAKENARPRREPGGFDSYGGGPPPQRRGPAPGRGVRLTIRGLSPDVSWQDLKDFGREGGAVIYADVNRAGEGVLEYASMGEAEQALDRLSTQTIRGGKVDIVIDDAPPPPRGGPPPRDDYRGGGGGGGYDRGYDRGGDRGGYGGRDSYRDRRSPPPRRDYGDRYEERGPPRDYRDRSPRRDRDRSPPPRSRDYGRDDRRSPPPPSRERDLPPRRGDDRDYRY